MSAVARAGIAGIHRVRAWSASHGFEPHCPTSMQLDALHETNIIPQHPHEIVCNRCSRLVASARLEPQPDRARRRSCGLEVAKDLQRRLHGGYMSVTWRLHDGYMAVTWRLPGGYIVGREPRVGRGRGTSGRGGSGERGVGGGAGLEPQRHLQGWCRRAWRGRRCWVGTLLATCRGGPGERGVGSQAVLGWNLACHLQGWCCLQTRR